MTTVSWNCRQNILTPPHALEQKAVLSMAMERDDWDSAAQAANQSDFHSHAGRMPMKSATMKNLILMMSWPRLCDEISTGVDLPSKI